MAESITDTPSARRSLANSTIRIAVLGRQRDQHHKPDLGVEVEHEAGHENADEGAEHADRHRKQHRDRNEPAFVEAHEEQVGEQHREPEHDTGLSVGCIFLVGRAGPLVTVAVGQRLGRQRRHRGQRGAGRDAGAGAALNRNGTVVVVACDDLRTLDDAERRQRA